MHQPHRAMTRALAALALSTLLLTACGNPGNNPGADLTPAPSPSLPTESPSATETTMPAESSESPKPSPTMPTDPEAAGTAMLNVTIKQTAEGEPMQYVLECTPDGVGEKTNLRNAEAACAAVMSLGAEFFTEKRDPDQMCTQQYGGPQTAEIWGTIDGQQVSASFSATDGCEIARWTAMETVLGAGGAM
ncbi:SSI family serine proteinase inhibitor [Arthrobacter sp. H5]|uniref:SSI family serine proteinase inhibitor n=1 Tax=Arthrobacter sp. H5 TaxID=1267973 RepID=UPI0004B92F98|nr:SSI family serine proteinase inhibitor [Arthrobacter sp. H5]